MQQYYDPDEYTNDAENGDGGNLIKDLRTQIKKAHEDLRAAQQTIEQQSRAIRDRTVADVLAAKGVPTKVAKLIPADIEASEAAVTKWLEEYQDLFPTPQSNEEPQNQQQNAGGSEPPPDELAARRMTNTMQGGRVAEPRLDDLINQVQNADPASLLALIEASKRGG